MSHSICADAEVEVEVDVVEVVTSEVVAKPAVDVEDATPEVVSELLEVVVVGCDEELGEKTMNAVANERRRIPAISRPIMA